MNQITLLALPNDAKPTPSRPVRYPMRSCIAPAAMLCHVRVATLTHAVHFALSASRVLAASGIARLLPERKIMPRPTPGITMGTTDISGYM